ncbi:tyrosine-type recombinase/integrase [Alienimonas sp. DA493]|uniref:tyrosine-type recombinase/integrase n=1 Tax=Alienimonas sp. DA493 TaxID=3373605 RepID=UPI0037541AE6
MPARSQPRKPSRKTARQPGKRAAAAAEKPYPDFPLTPHRGSGRWCKKIRGKLHYFGRLNDWRAALEEYQRVRDDLQAGRAPRPATEGLTIRDLLNRFLTEKERRVESGELSPRSWDAYRRNCARIAKHFGTGRTLSSLGPEDFSAFRAALAKGRGPVTLGNYVRHCRVVFKFAYDEGLVDRPLVRGRQFRPPSKSVIRRDRQARGPKLFTPEECLALLRHAAPQLRAMILLGLNCGFGNTDCADLPRSALDLDAGRLDFARPKTGIERQAVLWPETVDVLRLALEARRAPRDKEDADLVFLTRNGLRVVRCVVQPDGTASTTDSVGQAFSKARAAAGIKAGRGFYCLRSTFRTHADAARDQPAADLIMGHADESMAAIYRQTIDWDRLQAVAEVVRERALAAVRPRPGAAAE